MQKSLHFLLQLLLKIVKAKHHRIKHTDEKLTKVNDFKKAINLIKLIPVYTRLRLV